MTTDFLSHFPGSSIQIYDDKLKEKKQENLPILQGRTLGWAKNIKKEDLQAFNKEGYAITFTPNSQKDGKRGSKKTDAINAWFVDIDDKKDESGESVYPKSEQYNRLLSKPGVHPSFIVESKNGYHAYFLARDAKVENFKKINQAIAKYYGGDTSCVDTSRVLRLPGFYHQKEKPFKVEIREYDPEIYYTEEEIVRAFNVDLTPDPVPSPQQSHTDMDIEIKDPFWNALNNIDNKTALERLSGTKYVNKEIFTFRKRDKNSLFIDVNDTPADAWLDEQGMIGSGAGKNGGPTWMQWLKYYGHDYAKIANISKSLFKDLIPAEIIEASETPPPQIIDDIALKSEKIQDIADYILVYHGNNLCFHAETRSLYFYHPDTGHHEYLSQTDMLQRIHDVLRFVIKFKKNITNNLRNEIYDCLLLSAIKITITEQPFIATKDGLLHIETLQITPNNIENFCPIYLPNTVEDMQSMPTPTWNYYLESVLVQDDDAHTPDPELKQLFIEMCGYYLSPVRRPHALFFLIGKTRSGKGVFVNGVLSELFGDRLTSTLSLDDLTHDTHAPSDLVGKRLNICDEDESQYIENGLLKKICAEDKMRANPKYEKGFTFVNRAKVIVLGNHSPKLQRLDQAMKERLVFINFNRHFLPHERDWELANKLKKELPGIVWQMIKGWQQLQTNNYRFTQAKQSLRALRDLELETSSVHDWFEDNFLLTPSEGLFEESFFSSSKLFQMYRNWCNDSGRKPIQKRTFYVEIKLITGKESERTRVEFKQQRGYHLIEKNKEDEE